MDIRDVLSPDRVRFLDTKTKSETLDLLVGLLAAAPEVADAADLLVAIRRREGMMSTGIGVGVAVPHVRIKSVRSMVMAVGIHRTGLADYESIDGEPVRIVAMIAAGEQQHAEYIGLLSQVVGLLKQPDRREAVLAAAKAAEAYALLTGA